jgi:hypothetical protein
MPPIPLDKKDVELAKHAVSHGVQAAKAVNKRYQMLGEPLSPRKKDLGFRGAGRNPNEKIVPDAPVEIPQLRNKMKKIGYEPKEPVHINPKSLERRIKQAVNGEPASIYPDGHYHALIHNPNTDSYLQHEKDIEAVIQRAVNVVIGKYKWAYEWRKEMEDAARDRLIKMSGATVNNSTIADDQFRFGQAYTGAMNILRPKLTNKIVNPWTTEKLSNNPPFTQEKPELEPIYNNQEER